MNTEPVVNTPESPAEAVAMPLREESEAAAKARVMINHLRKGWSEEEACFAAELYADKYYY